MPVPHPFVASRLDGAKLNANNDYLENLTLFAQITSFSANYTIALVDASRTLRHPSSDTTARTVLIQSNATLALPIGFQFVLRNANGAGALTINVTSDTLRLAGSTSTGSRTLAANGVAYFCKEEATVWFVDGSGLT